MKLKPNSCRRGEMIERVFFIFLIMLFLPIVSLANIDVGSESIEKKSLVLVPMLGLVVPGSVQFFDGEKRKGLSLLGYGGLGFLIGGAANKKVVEFRNNDSLHFHGDLDNQRIEKFGLAMFKHASLISVYDSFRSRVQVDQKEGQYSFLPQNYNLELIHKAPFQFHYLKKPTTWIPLALGAAGGAFLYGRNPKPRSFALRPIDLTTGLHDSYVAGVSEEALFRGWMQPILYENTQQLWIANSIQAIIFGYAHGPQPYFQIVAGYYFGWLTPKNNWDLEEVIFIHTWWDIFVITAEYARQRSFTHDFNIQVPLINTSF